MEILQRLPRWARGRRAILLVLAAMLSTVAAGVAVSSSLGSGSTARAVDSNLLTNSEFESSPYSAYYTYGSGTFIWATDQSWSVTHSLEIVSTQPQGSLARWLSNTTSISARPGTSYRASVSLKTQGVVQQANLSLDFWNAAGAYLGSTYDSAPVSGTRDWSGVSVQAIAPSGAAFVRVEFRLWGPGTVWFDSAFLTASGGGVPVNTEGPAVTVIPSFPGYVFKATPGTWANAPNSLQYQWYWTPSDVGSYDGGVAKGTGDTLVLNWPVPAGYITVAVTARNAAGAATATGYVIFSPSELSVVSLPVIGGTPRSGSTLSTQGRGGYVGLGTGVPSAEYSLFRVTWVRCDTAGANCTAVKTSEQFDISPTMTYDLTKADVGSTIRVLDWSGSVMGNGRTFMTVSAPTAVVTS